MAILTSDQIDAVLGDSTWLTRRQINERLAALGLPTGKSAQDEVLAVVREREARAKAEAHERRVAPYREIARKLIDAADSGDESALDDVLNEAYNSLPIDDQYYIPIGITEEGDDTPLDERIETLAEDIADAVERTAEDRAERERQEALREATYETIRDVAERLADALGEPRPYRSGLSLSTYVSEWPTKIRISDHAARPTYEMLHGRAWREIAVGGGHMEAHYYLRPGASDDEIDEVVNAIVAEYRAARPDEEEEDDE